MLLLPGGRRPQPRRGRGATGAILAHLPAGTVRNDFRPASCTNSCAHTDFRSSFGCRGFGGSGASPGCRARGPDCALAASPVPVRRDLRGTVCRASTGCTARARFRRARPLPLAGGSSRPLSPVRFRIRFPPARWPDPAPASALRAAPAASRPAVLLRAWRRSDSGCLAVVLIAWSAQALRPGAHRVPPLVGIRAPVAIQTTTGPPHFLTGGARRCASRLARCCLVVPGSLRCRMTRRLLPCLYAAGTRLGRCWNLEFWRGRSATGFTAGAAAAPRKGCQNGSSSSGPAIQLPRPRSPCSGSASPRK